MKNGMFDDCLDRIFLDMYCKDDNECSSSGAGEEHCSNGCGSSCKSKRKEPKNNDERDCCYKCKGPLTEVASIGFKVYRLCKNPTCDWYNR